jgi:hypothetical protein
MEEWMTSSTIIVPILTCTRIRATHQDRVARADSLWHNNTMFSMEITDTTAVLDNRLHTGRTYAVLPQLTIRRLLR